MDRQQEDIKTISVVIPVYFNELSVPVLYQRLAVVKEELRSRNFQMELIFVDDGSGDGSHAALLKLREHDKAIKIIKHTRNFGSVHAIKTGLMHVTGDCFTILAADVQDPPELILDMVDQWLCGAKFVICEREQREDPFFSKLYAALYYKIIIATVNKHYPQGGFDLALMDGSMLPYMKKGGKNTYTLLYAYWLGFEPVTIKYKREKREHGTSMWTFSKKLKVFVDVILGFSYAPIRIMSTIGLIVSTVSFSYGLFVTVNALFGNVEVPGFATITSLVTFLLGLIIIMLGVIGEYVWRILTKFKIVRKL